MRFFDQLNVQTRRAAGAVQEAADAHQVAARSIRETADAATAAFVAVAVVAVVALAFATAALVVSHRG